MMREPSRPDGCLSDFAIDRWLAGELGAAEVTALEAHAAGCTRCSRRVADVRSEREAFAREAPPLVLRPPSRPPRWLWGGGVIAAAAGILVFLQARGGDDGHGATRAKGSGSAIGFYVSHAGVVRLGAPGERVVPGDALRFVVTAREPRYVAILSVDGARHASVYYAPPPAGAAVTGADVPLPASTVLDETLGDETIYGVLCPQPFDAESLRRSLEASPARAPVLDGCDVDTLRIRKEAPSSP